MDFRENHVCVECSFACLFFSNFSRVLGAVRIAFVFACVCVCACAFVCVFVCMRVCARVVFLDREREREREMYVFDFTHAAGPFRWFVDFWMFYSVLFIGYNILPITYCLLPLTVGSYLLPTTYHLPFS